MGYFRDDTPLMELILDEKGQKELNRLWDEFDFIAEYTRRTWVQYYFNQSGEVQGKGAESGQAASAGSRDHRRAVISRMRDAYLAKAAANPKNDPVRHRGHPRSLRARQRHSARPGKGACRTPSRSIWKRCSDSPRAPIAGR